MNCIYESDDCLLSNRLTNLIEFVGAEHALEVSACHTPLVKYVAAQEQANALDVPSVHYVSLAVVTLLLRVAGSLGL